MVRYIMIIAINVLLICSNAHATLWDRGGGLIYDDDLDITWLQDANYAMTSGYDSDGKMTWSKAMDWADQLEFGGFYDWRLPFTYGDIGDQHGYYATGSEMGHLYYAHLRCSDGPFINLERYYYWYSDLHMHAGTGDIAWTLRFSDGHQGAYMGSHYAWAVHDGDIANVPILGAVWLLGTGLFGLAGLRRKLKS